MAKRKPMRYWTDYEVMKYSGVKRSGEYSWRKDLRQTFRRDLMKAKTPTDYKIAWLLRKQAILENELDGDKDDLDEYFYKIGRIREEIEELRKKK